MSEHTLRGLPAVHRFLSDPRIAAFETLLGRERVKRAVTQVLDEVRRSASSGSAALAHAEGDGAQPEIADAVLRRLQNERYESLVRVINATGVLLHTNLGRAPIAPAALEALRDVSRGYSNIEFDLLEGRRGSRYARVTALLQGITGAEDALVVNNCAAAVLLILDTFAKGRQVVVARSELIEVGGGFRLPDVLQRSGATLVEVGTANKTYVEEYERALTPSTALLLRTHPSNFRITGFTHEVEPRELAALGRRAGIPVVEDLGSGALVDLAEYGLPHERTVQDALSDGIDIVAFSGDKVLGGPQAGVIVGRSPLVSRLRSNPLLRALRVDKITLAALAETLRMYATPHRRAEIPFFAMLGASIETLQERARWYVSQIPDAAIVESTAYAGGGTLPQSELPSVALALRPRSGAQRLAAALRESPVPVIGRVEENRVLLDLRTILPGEDGEVLAALKASPE
ncbi:MAG TPA: L-seryl-tRNA(Sec) selenium transferase [Candidatus Baltobacteraceae bacterium]|jgi:L-seryl-tRNA(Ser) seleniumtransferase|nr:L-seryl-tRNA(Sec) selenium transferase [Candidatus Baltobacteraceae bacterium]